MDLFSQSCNICFEADTANLKHVCKKCFSHLIELRHMFSKIKSKLELDEDTVTNILRKVLHAMNINDDCVDSPIEMLHETSEKQDSNSENVENSPSEDLQCDASHMNASNSNDTARIEYEQEQLDKQIKFQFAGEELRNEQENCISNLMESVNGDISGKENAKAGIKSSRKEQNTSKIPTLGNDLNGDNDTNDMSESPEIASEDYVSKWMGDYEKTSQRLIYSFPLDMPESVIAAEKPDFITAYKLSVAARKRQALVAAETEADPYPKRNIPERNYAEESNIPADNYVYCDFCQEEYLIECPTHSLLISNVKESVNGDISGKENAKAGIKSSRKEQNTSKMAPIPTLGNDLIGDNDADTTDYTTYDMSGIAAQKPDFIRPYEETIAAKKRQALVAAETETEAKRQRVNEQNSSNAQNSQGIDAQNAFKCDGPAYILEHFDTYYSILYHLDKVDVDIIIKSINDLTESCRHLQIHLENILEESEIPVEIQLKTLNIMKMLMYLLIHTLIQLEIKIDLRNKRNINLVTKGRKKPVKNLAEGINIEEKEEILNLFLHIIELPINKLWDPPICEQQYINLIAEVCYALLQIPTIKTQKEICHIMFNIFGILLKNYNYALTFSVRLTQIVKLKDNDHLVPVIPNGIKKLVEEYHCKSLVRELVREFTEWQSDENYQDAPGTKHCSNILIEMTALMPNLMLAEVVYLQKYLNFSSYTLRNCVLSITTEVIVNVLSEENMEEERKEIRDDLLMNLNMHICDSHAHVRSRVLQCWTKLLAESAIPLDTLPDLVRKVARRLNDKGALVRKNALHLLTAFLNYNPYSSKLDVNYYKAELEKETAKLSELQNHSASFTLANITKKDDEWNKMKNDVQMAIVQVLEQQSGTAQLSHDASFASSSELVRMYLANGQYVEAVQLCRLAQKNSKYAEAMQKAREGGDEAEIYFQCLHSIYVDIFKSGASLINSMQSDKGRKTEEQLSTIENCEKTVKYFTHVVDFLTTICAVVSQVKELLHSNTLSDVNEAIQFFVAANQFEIEFAQEGLTEMLSLMNSTDKDRVNAVIEAYKTVFLTAENNSERPGIIVRRLMKLVTSVTKTTEQYLSSIVAQWVSSGDLDAHAIELLWKIFTGRVSAESPDECVAALQLLTMAATGRVTIAERNMHLVAELAFGERGYADLRLAITACRMLAGLGAFVVDVTSATPTFRVPVNDPLWAKVHDLLVNCFKKKDVYYAATVAAAIQLIFKLCSKPDKVSSRIIHSVTGLLSTGDSIDCAYLAQFTHLLGVIAANYFIYMDVSVYKELKRRAFVREEKRKTNKKRAGSIVNTSVRSVNVSVISATHKLNSRTDDLDDTTYMEGATAYDEDAEFILRVFNSEIVNDNLLGHFTPMLVHILKHPHNFDDENLQASTVLALMRFMSVTQLVCEEHLRLVMAVLDMTKYTDVKNNIIVALADLVHRYPNIIEPWSARLYERVKDKEESVRMTAVSVIISLLMEDMLRVKGTVADLALCIVDPCSTIVQMTKYFFNALSKKGNTIYNILPDIISRLSNNDVQVDEQVFRQVIGFLIILIDKDRQIEPLVEKLCLRLQLTDEPRQWRDITYCLTLLNQNEKSLERLIANYRIYKKCLEDDDVYKEFISIVQKYKNHAKDEIKNNAKKLDQLLSTGEIVAEENENESSCKKKPRAKRTKRLKS